MKKNFTQIGKKVIELQVQALNKVKKSLGKSKLTSKIISFIEDSDKGVIRGMI